MERRKEGNNEGRKEREREGKRERRLKEGRAHENGKDFTTIL